MSNSHLFEHPLNEKSRVYLRIEALFTQMQLAAQFNHSLDSQLFFRSLFDMLDIFEQTQLKTELGKDIEKQRIYYRNWLNVEGVDQARLLTLLDEIDQVHRHLLAGERFGQSLKEDRFLSTIRQRFNLPGGTCCFDLPALHYWRRLPNQQHIQDAKRWMRPLKPLFDALALWLRLTRETGYFSAQSAPNCFYQGDAEGANILRLNIPLEVGVFPMISGHKNRFAIKFIDFETNKADNKTVPFELAICN